MSGFDLALARDAADLIPGLTVEERDSVVENLRDDADEYAEPDMTLKDARATAESLRKTMEKMFDLAERLRGGWGAAGLQASMATQRAVHHILYLRHEGIPAEVDAMVAELNATKVAGGHGGLLAQRRGRTKKRDALMRLAIMWFRATLTSPRVEAGAIFVDVAFAAIGGDGDVDRVLPEVIRDCESGFAAIPAAKHLARIGGIARINTATGVNPDSRDRGRVLRDRFRRLLSERLLQEG